MFPPTDHDRAVRELVFSMIPKLGPVTARRLLEEMGDLEAVYAARVIDFLGAEGFQKRGAEHVYTALRSPSLIARAEKEIRFLDSLGCRQLFIEHEDYPHRLRHCGDGPVLLFYRGHANLNHERVVAVVGSRKATDYGKGITANFLAKLGHAQILVISGLAYGIDIAAHRACVAQNICTVGVLGHGLDTLYPAPHRSMAEKMVSRGGLLTELMSGTLIQPGLFPRRNRIIAGLCDALVVVEAASKGGALITAGLANSYDREVFAFPGRISDPYSAGCLELIGGQQAQLITSAEDFMERMGWSLDIQSPQILPGDLDAGGSGPKESAGQSKGQGTGSGLDLKPEDDPVREAGSAPEHDPNLFGGEAIMQFLMEKGKSGYDDLLIQFPAFKKNLPELILSLELEGKVRWTMDRCLETV